jgi:hypothetical protein
MERGESVNRDHAEDEPELMRNIQSSEIFVDEEGEWFNEGNAIHREDILAFFLENVQELPDGSYVIAWGENRCALRAADTPFVVTRVDLKQESEETPAQILVKLKHLPQPEMLDPRTLCSGRDNILHGQLHDSRHRARFSRPAYYQLAQWIEEDVETGGFCLSIAGERFPIRTES